MTPPNPPSSPSTASLSGVARCWHSNAYFSLFSSLFFFDPPNGFVQFRGTLQFRSCWLCYFRFRGFLDGGLDPPHRVGGKPKSFVGLEAFDRLHRRVIDVSGDGDNNSGRDVTAARDEAIAKGVTINGLAILTETPTVWNCSVTPSRRAMILTWSGRRSPSSSAEILLLALRRLMVAENSNSFGDMLVKKLITEIAQPVPSSGKGIDKAAWRCAAGIFQRNAVFSRRTSALPHLTICFPELDGEANHTSGQERIPTSPWRLPTKTSIQAVMEMVSDPFTASLKYRLPHSSRPSPLMLSLRRNWQIVYCYLYGTPIGIVTSTVGYLRLYLRVHFRVLVAILFLTRAATAALVGWVTYEPQPKELPTFDELIERETTKADNQQCASYGFKSGTDGFAHCRMELDERRRERHRTFQ